MIEETKFVVEVHEAPKYKDVLLREIPNNTAFTAQCCTGRRTLYMKFGGVVVCPEYPSWHVDKPTETFLDYRPVKKVRIIVEEE